MEKWELRLIAKLLRDAHDLYVNHCCNDFDLRSEGNLTGDEIVVAIRAFDEYLVKDCAGYVPNDNDVSTIVCNYELMDMLANRCESVIKETE